VGTTVMEHIDIGGTPSRYVAEALPSLALSLS
jgi:hypothetical protein